MIFKDKHSLTFKYYIMKLKNINFGYVLGQSGIQGFFGEGDEYPHHKVLTALFGLFGFSFKGMTFVAKTTSLEPRIYPEKSQTALVGYKLKQWFPRSIWFSLKSIIQGYVLNAMGIPSPGAVYLLALKSKYQKRNEPFQLSFMPMETSLQGKIKEVKDFCNHLLYYLPPEKHLYGVQMNVSCPNTGHAQTEALEEWIALAKIFTVLMSNTPLIFKLDLTIDQKVVSELQKYCDAICIGNTLAFGKLPKQVDWKNLFKNGSPLSKIFGNNFQGGLSGKPLFPVLVDWLQRMDELDPSITIIAGGGIMTKDDITTLHEFKCVKAVALGSVAITRPWRMQSLINHGNTVFS
jgi:dihydroorotate dehydrogenase